jgi:uncharacterized protein (TIGR00255 family)
MTGFSKAEASENGITATIELKSLNGRNLELSCRMPRNLNHKEIELREILKVNIARGSVNISINVQRVDAVQQFVFNKEAATACYNELNEFRKDLKLKETVKLEHVLHFASTFAQPEQADDSENEWKVVKKALKTAVISLNKMKANEGAQISKDMLARMKKISGVVDKIESLGAAKIPEERERLRQKVAQLFDSDEIDEHRLQLELVLIADKLDISEECVRLRSHIKFFFDAFKENEPIGRKVNFLMQEMNREINTIGSKSNDTEIAHLVVAVKEDLERIREQIQNVE